MIVKFEASVIAEHDVSSSVTCDSISTAWAEKWNSK